MVCSLPGSLVHRISQVRILERIAISFSRDLPTSGIELESPALAGESFTTELPGKPDLQSRTRDTDIESKCLDAKGERWCGRNWKIGIDVGGC